MRLLLMLCACLAVPAAALAQVPAPAPAEAGTMAGMNHSPGAMLTSSTPANGETTAPPPALVLNFMHPMQVSSLQLFDSLGARVPLAQPPATPATQVTLPLPRLASDSYELRWAAAGADHADNGVVRFQVR